MANWHYYNEIGKKVGPIRGRELKELAQQGTVTPETRVENENGQTALAKHIKGLPFYETTPSETEPSELSTVMPPSPTEANPFAATLAEPNPFVAVPPVEANPFRASIPGVVSPVSPKSEWSLGAIMASAMRGTMRFIAATAGLVTALVLAVFVVWMLYSLLVLTGTVPPPPAGSVLEKWLLFGKPDIQGVSIPTGENGNGYVELTAEEQAVADKILAEHGKNAMAHYLSRYMVYEAHAHVQIKEIQETFLKYSKYFLSKGADVNAKDSDGGMTALHWAARIGIEPVKFLVSKGANVNAKREYDGCTPLMYAVMDGHVEIVKYLVEQGADVNVKAKGPNTNSREMSPLEVAKEILEEIGTQGMPDNLPKELQDRFRKRKEGLPTVVEYLSSLAGNKQLPDEPPTSSTPTPQMPGGTGMPQMPGGTGMPPPQPDYSRAVPFTATLRQSGFKYTSDFVRYGNTGLKLTLDNANTELKNCDPLDDRGLATAKAKVNAAQTAIGNELRKIAETIFFDERNCAVDNVNNQGGGISNLDMHIYRIDGVDYPVIREVLLPIPSVNQISAGQHGYHGGSTTRFTVSGDTSSIAKLRNNINNYRGRVWFNNLRSENSVNVLRAEIVRAGTPIYGQKPVTITNNITDGTPGGGAVEKPLSKVTQTVDLTYTNLTYTTASPDYKGDDSSLKLRIGVKQIQNIPNFIPDFRFHNPPADNEVLFPSELKVTKVEVKEQGNLLEFSISGKEGDLKELVRNGTERGNWRVRVGFGPKRKNNDGTLSVDIPKIELVK